MLGSPRKGRPKSTNQHFPAQHKYPDQLQDIPLLHEAGNPALINQQTPSITSLLLIALVYKNLSPRAALQSSFLLALLNLDAARLMIFSKIYDCWIFPLTVENALNQWDPSGKEIKGKKLSKPRGTP